ncbi:hypothetical protein [Mesorhizobium sp.]|uniref:hypothetical protein n=1 Tax=Mesorhizobium sp. TaxID=1871066 RepID=UPI0012073D19|nr:hypothetical protein [Mesorhizobium sp.]TIL64811.1 MAG: hypothetical protein E5Y77_24795 [Mesorhizobium sp.]
MAQAIQHKGETVAKLREGEEWVVVGTKIVIFKPSNPTYSREISTIGAYSAPLLAGQTGMILTNLCVSGSALGLSTTGYPSYGMSNRIVDIPADTEIVTLEPGPNAFGAQETPLGAFGDTTYATHYGSLWAACVAIRLQAPSAKIVMIGTYSGGPSHATHRIGRVNGQGNTMDQFFEAERYVAHALGIPFIDISQRHGLPHADTVHVGRAAPACSRQPAPCHL